MEANEGWYPAFECVDMMTHSGWSACAAQAAGRVEALQLTLERQWPLPVSLLHCVLVVRVAGRVGAPNFHVASEEEYTSSIVPSRMIEPQTFVQRSGLSEGLDSLLGRLDHVYCITTLSISFARFRYWGKLPFTPEG